MEDTDDDSGSFFISAVCWKSDSPTMLTANSQGTIKVLILAAWSQTINSVSCINPCDEWHYQMVLYKNLLAYGKSESMMLRIILRSALHFPAFSLRITLGGDQCILCKFPCFPFLFISYLYLISYYDVFKFQGWKFSCTMGDVTLQLFSYVISVYFLLLVSNPRAGYYRPDTE